MPVIEVTHLYKSYRDRVAVQDVSFTMEQGEIFGIVGPNGAGKTRTVECVAGLCTPDKGTVRVLGLDPTLITASGTNREVTARLFVSEATIKTHLLHIYEKLGVSDRAAAVGEAYRRGILK